MAEGLTNSVVRISPSPWLPAAVESEAFEGIRRGDKGAFRVLAEPLQPVLRRLARVIVLPSAGASRGPSRVVDGIIARVWSHSLRALDMFRWNTPFASWIAGGVVVDARSHAGLRDRDHASATSRTPRRPVAGPDDWSDLPWAARWEDALPTLNAALAALPLPQREVVHTRDVEQWPTRRVCDVLGLVGVDYEHLLAEGREQLWKALAPLVGETTEGPHWVAQTAAIVRVLGNGIEDRAEPLDAGTVAAFHQWRASRLTGWRRVGALFIHPAQA
jgi:DNA-directed RNA polymerase specialized sigma24 family protein